MGGRDWKECSGGDIANKSPPPPFLPTTTVNAKLFRRKNTQGFPRAGEEKKKLGFIDALDYWPVSSTLWETCQITILDSRDPNPEGINFNLAQQIFKVRNLGGN